MGIAVILDDPLVVIDGLAGVPVMIVVVIGIVVTMSRAARCKEGQHDQSAAEQAANSETRRHGFSSCLNPTRLRGIGCEAGVRRCRASSDLRRSDRTREIS